MSVDQQNMTNCDYYNIKCLCKKKKICHILNIRDTRKLQLDCICNAIKKFTNEFNLNSLKQYPSISS